MNNPYGRASASPRHSTSPSVATRQTSSSSIARDANGNGGVGVGVEGWGGAGNGLALRREPRGQGSTDTLRINTNSERDPRDDVIEDLKADLEKLRKICTCVICQELLFEPYFFQCGHVYCYGVSGAISKAVEQPC